MFYVNNLDVRQSRSSFKTFMKVNQTISYKLLVALFVTSSFLQKVCSTLRDQREEQIMYFKQKEISLQQNMEQEVDKIKQEKAAVVKSLTEMKLENANLKYISFYSYTNGLL